MGSWGTRSEPFSAPLAHSLTVIIARKNAPGQKDFSDTPRAFLGGRGNRSGPAVRKLSTGEGALRHGYCTGHRAQQQPKPGGTASRADTAEASSRSRAPPADSDFRIFVQGREKRDGWGLEESRSQKVADETQSRTNPTALQRGTYCALGLHPLARRPKSREYGTRTLGAPIDREGRELEMGWGLVAIAVIV